MNLSNTVSTNIFESFTGVLNIAPVKLSGQYKIVVGLDNFLYLDDYNNRRVQIDKSQRFLPQLATFLKSSSLAPKENLLKYGAFSSVENGISHKYYHAPIYLNQANNSLPNYFVVSKVLNETIVQSSDLQKYGEIIYFIDLESIGIKNIFDEILIDSHNKYDYPVTFNWEDAKVNIFGYSIKDNVPTSKSLSFQNNQANQPYLAVVNNWIANSFVREQIIFPRFVNIEFEFDYINNKIPFNNFYGHYSVGNEIVKANFNPDIFTVSTQKYSNKKIVYKQEKLINNINLIDFNDIIGTSTIVHLGLHKPQVRIQINRISAEDSITILNPDNTGYFKYIVKPEDIIESSLRQTLKNICTKATELSDRFFVFTEKNNIITIKSNIEDLDNEEYKISVSKNFRLIDNNQVFFKAIKSTDIALSLNVNFNIIKLYKKLKIDNIFYDVIDTFIFDGEIILRLNKSISVNSSTSAEIYIIKNSKLIQLPQITMLSVNSDLEAFEQYNVTEFISELRTKFVEGASNDLTVEVKNATITAIDDFELRNTTFDKLPYVIENSLNELELTNKIIQDTTNNNNGIKTMMFNSPGTTGYITPNILNIDKSFYDKNGNTDNNLLSADLLCFHWFLIKSPTPKYLQNNIRNLRYFTELPKLTSKLILNGDVYSSQSFCETIFLGVKYQLPQKYAGYQFAVYLNYNDVEFIDINYKFVINNIDKTLYLEINKYFDFVDLLRGGVETNEPLIDLSFLYNIRESYNTQSENLSGFKSGGLLLANNTIQTLFDDVLTTDWKIFDTKTNNWYICLKRSPDVITSPFDELFPSSGNIEFYVYSSVIINGIKHTYVSITFTIKNIRFVRGEFLWCEDLTIKFFDTEDILIRKLGIDSETFASIPKENILQSNNISNELYGDYNVISTIIVDATQQQFKLINHDKTFSFKENYFELNKQVIFNEDSAIPRTITKSFFVFPEFLKPAWTLNDFVLEFEQNSFDNSTSTSKISIFDRNQIWRLIQDILVVDIKFKYASELQIRNSINDLFISQLKEYADLYSIPIKNTSEFIKLSIVDNDINLAIWKVENQHKAHKINRHRGPYLPYLRKLNNELEFQADINSNPKNSLYNIYDKDFGGTNITATGLWKEVTGNIVSSLFTKSSEIIIELPFAEEFNLRDLLKYQVSLSEAIIVNRNENYISKINHNIDEYILESYIDWLLLNVYELSLIRNELNQKIEFTKNTKNIYSINIKPIRTFQTRFNNLIFSFTRK